MAGRYPRSGDAAIVPKPGVLAELILWLRRHNFEDRQIAGLLEISPSNLRTILTRWRQRGPTSSEIRFCRKGLTISLTSFFTLPQQPSAAASGCGWKKLRLVLTAAPSKGCRIWKTT